MKRIVIVFFVILLSCSKEDEVDKLNISYEQELIEVDFLTTGETAEPTVNWNQNKGFFKATSRQFHGDEFVGRVVFLDSLTGVLSWNKRLPLGENKIEVTAVGDSSEASVIVIIKNSFKKGFFVGGFSDEVPEEIDYSIVTYDTFMRLEENGSTTMWNDVPLTNVIAFGEWYMNRSQITIKYSRESQPDENYVIVGRLYGKEGIPKMEIKGKWGIGITPDNEVDKEEGLVKFEND
ncbi:hypothetical protein [Tenacibaculum xiamenense]|uniref:hypothetical protein n=1 Tax=Tenacibaculum xiamenense TaxID=1261553 RepID=UPI003894B343